jgi:hypothetical protein
MTLQFAGAHLYSRLGVIKPTAIPWFVLGIAW